MLFLLAPLLFLLLKGLFLVPPGEATEVYYVIPSTDPPNCPGEPCLPLDGYMDDPERYFSREMVNITLEFLPGLHTTRHENVGISNLETFKMAGIQDVGDIIICFSVVFTNITQVLIETLTVSSTEGCSSPRISFAKISTIVIKSVTGRQLGSSQTAALVKNSTDLHVDCVLFPLGGTVAVSGDSCVLVTAYSNITVTNNTIFANKQDTAITAYSSIITLSGNVAFLNNTGTKGGAMALYSSTLNIASNTSVYFHNNVAREVGGAIYVSKTKNPYNTHCFYQLLDYVNTSEAYNVRFKANRAETGGDHIYGVNMKSVCSVAYYNGSSLGWIGETIKSYQAMEYFFTFDTESISSISSDPRGICLCDTNGRPQCANSISNIYLDREVRPGETFSLSVVIVGGNFGTTTGTVYADFLLPSSLYTKVASLKADYQHAQWITNNKKCFNLQYTIYSNHSHEPFILYLTSTNELRSVVRNSFSRKSDLEEDISTYHSTGVISDNLLRTPIFLNITLLPCPPGFSLMGDPPRCDCYMYPEVAIYDVNCTKVGTISWSGPLWIGIPDKGIISINYQCPLDYCKPGHKNVNFQNDTDAQCAFNRAGRLCGGCKEGYSLAIGSSHCIHCPNNNNLALLIFFAAAGFLLVFFISVLNLTVTQGMINGLIFYANIVWAYQDILFPQQVGETKAFMIFQKTFIAWLNLDFGIQTCFIDGLTAFWKTWLQYVFPFYTAGLFIIGLRYSSKLSKLFGSRSVPTLATLLFLSHTKLLRTIITSLELAHLTNFPTNSTEYVWSIDGRLDYGRFPHIFLLLAAIACLLLLWMPYTALLFSMQWLRRISYFRISKWITRYKPFFDAYYAPLKDQHHYWFGVLLLARGILLLISSLTANLNPAISLFLLLGMATVLLCYMNHVQIYKRKSVLIIESAFLMNLVLLVGGVMYYRDAGNGHKVTLIYVSVGLAFVKFCGIAVWSLILICLRRRKSEQQLYSDIHSKSEATRELRTEDTIQGSGRFRDSILEDAPLLCKSRLPTY